MTLVSISSAVAVVRQVSYAGYQYANIQWTLADGTLPDLSSAGTVTVAVTQDGTTHTWNYTGAAYNSPMAAGQVGGSDSPDQTGPPEDCINISYIDADSGDHSSSGDNLLQALTTPCSIQISYTVTPPLRGIDGRAIFSCPQIGA
jgi:hypothetical protein